MLIGLIPRCIVRREKLPICNRAPVYTEWP